MSETKFSERINLNGHELKDYIFPIVLGLLFIISSIAFFKMYDGQDIWSGMKLAGGNAFKFCEHHNENGASLIQTSNTWSNLGFLFVGLLLLFMGIKDSKLKSNDKMNMILRFPVFSIIMGISILYLFIGSFFYHASVTFIFQMLDQTGMYAILLSFVAYNVFRIWPEIKSKNGEIKSSHPWIIIGLIVLNLLFITVLVKVDINILFTSLVFSFMGFSVYYNIKNKTTKFSKKLLNVAIAVYLTSMSIWILDRTDVFCDPNSIVQGHALWHILNSVSLLLIYFHYRSENILEKDTNANTL